MTDSSINPIVAALQAGDCVETERLSRVCLRKDPNASDALLLLGMSLHQQGRLVDAVEPFARMCELSPDDANCWGNYATALRVARLLDSAEQAAQTAVQLNPDDPARLDQLGMLQLQNGKPQAARTTLLRAFGKAPDSPAIRIDAARACVACRDYRAEDLVQPWREWLPLEDSLQYDLADVQARIGEAESAREVLEDLLRRTPSHRGAMLLLASLYERVNRLIDAEALLGRIPNDASALDIETRKQMAHQFAQLESRKGDFAAARTLLEAAGPSTESDCAYWFLLARVCDKLDDPAVAMRALEIAHARQVDELKVATPHQFEPDAQVLPGAQGRVSEEDYLRWPNLKAPDAKQSPVFVVGFPRSGTTLLEQMLDAHPRLQSMDERPFFNRLADQLDHTGVTVPQDLGRLDQRGCDELRKGYLTMACSKVPRRWGTQLVDKNPLNMLWLPMIHRMFPQARFILALRHPCDAILSCYMQNFQSAVLAAASQTLEDLGHAYVAAMESWLHHEKLMKPDVFVSRYEDLVSDMPSQASRIAEFLGLNDGNSMLNFAARARQKGYIKTPSYTQVIEPVNRRSVGRWQRYREYFGPVLPILRPILERCGYAADAAPVALDR